MKTAPRPGRMLGLAIVLAASMVPAARAQAPGDAAKPAPRPTTAPDPSPFDAPKGKAAQAAAASAGDNAADKTVPYIDLTNRYLFLEKYTKFEERAVDGLIGQYRVGITEVLRDTIDVAEGEPKTTEVTRQTLFTERPAEVNGLGMVAATIRNYSRFQIRPDDVVRSVGPRPLDGLTIYVRPQQNQFPLILSLSEDRRLREREYEVAARQVFLPSLAAILPGYAARVGDTWRVSRRGVQVLVGESNIRGESLTGKFIELRREAEGPRRVAVFSITGRVANAFAETTLNVEIRFTFVPVPIAAPSTAAANDPAAKATTVGKTRRESGPIDTMEARGGITDVRMARVATGILPGSKNKNLKYKASQELTLRRQIGVIGDPLNLPEIPASTDVNTWLTYVDAQARFFFHHPQELLPPERYQFVPTDSSGNMVTLVKNRPEGPDLVRVSIYDRELKEEDVRGLLAAEWEPTKLEVIKGSEEWLPESDWPGMKVFRVEAALKTGERAKGSSRLHYDGYLLQLGPRLNVIAVATTPRDTVSGFRRDVEQMLKTFKVGPGN